MKIYDIYKYSPCLNRDMNIRVYGHYGLPIIVFPSQNDSETNWERFGMIDVLSDYIEAGKIKIYSIPSIDMETWSVTSGDFSHTSYMIEQYFYYVIHDVMDIIREDCGCDIQPLLTGCSMGANHAFNIFLRQPQLFFGVIALSGVYDPSISFGGWADERVYNNTPLMYMKNMPHDHYFIDIYNSKKIISCVGQGAFEIGVDAQKEMEQIFKSKNINAWFDYWAHDVKHDWDWWRIQIRYFLDKIL